MPLGPKHLLYTAVGGHPPARGTVLTTEIARLFQRFSVEHAHRYVFAVHPDPDLEIWRPRHVSQADFLFETEQWEKWPESQLHAERELMRTAD